MINVQETWPVFKMYLVVEKKQSANSIPRLSSCFNILCHWLTENNLTFSKDSFNKFVYTLKERNLSTSYMNNHIKLAKHLANFLGSTEFRDYTMFRENQDTVLPGSMLTPEEIIKLSEVVIDYPRHKELRNARMKALILFLGTVGPRITETLSLKREWLTASPHPMVHFPAEVTKSKRARYCVIPKELYALLEKLPQDSTNLWGLHDYTVVNEDLKVRAAACGIKKRVYCHLFRHSSINNKLSAGMPLEIVTAYHGHSSTSITYKYYVHLQAQQMADYFYLYDPFFGHELAFDTLSTKLLEYADRLLKQKKYEKIVSSDTSGVLTTLKFLEGDNSLQLSIKKR